MINSEFKNLVEKRDILGIKVSLKNILLFTESFNDFDEMLGYVENEKVTIYEEHDGREFSNNENDWNQKLFDDETDRLVKNFSKTRIDNIKKILEKLKRNSKSSTQSIPKTTSSPAKQNTHGSNNTKGNIKTREFEQNNEKREKFEEKKEEDFKSFNRKVGYGLTALGTGILLISIFTGGIIKILLGLALTATGIILIYSSKN